MHISPFNYCNISIHDIANKFISMQANASLSLIWGSGSISMQMVVGMEEGGVKWLAGRALTSYAGSALGSVAALKG